MIYKENRKGNMHKPQKQKLFTVKVDEMTYFYLKSLKFSLEKRTRQSVSFVGLMAVIVGKYITEGRVEQGKADEE